MSVTVRLAKIGRKNLPAFRIVVSNTKDKRNGKFLDIIGSYNPSMTPVFFNYDKTKLEEWKKKGALVTDSVNKLIVGNYTFIPYKPNKKKGASEPADETKE